MKTIFINECRKELEEIVGLEKANFVTDADISDIIIERGPSRAAIMEELAETAMYKKIAAGDALEKITDINALQERVMKQISNKKKADTYKRAEGIKELLEHIRERIVIEDFAEAIKLIDTYLALVNLVLEETKNEKS